MLPLRLLLLGKPFPKREHDQVSHGPALALGNGAQLIPHIIVKPDRDRMQSLFVAFRIHGNSLANTH